RRQGMGSRGNGWVEVFNPVDWPKFVRFPAFTRDWERLGLNDDALCAPEIEILKDPTRSPVLPGTGGRGKLRFARPRSGRAAGGVRAVPTVTATAIFRISAPSLWS